VATIRDVAARAGVGVATVSRVLNDHPAVLDQTRDRVNAAIAELDYRPSRVARALSRRRTGTIAVLVPFFTHHSAVERLRGVMAVPDQRGLEIVLFNLAHFSQGWVQWGYRFSLDFIPFLLPMVALGAARVDGRPRVIAWVLVVAGLLVNGWGVIWGQILGW